MTGSWIKQWFVGAMVLALVYPIWAASLFTVQIAGYIGSSEIQEASGLAASRRYPGVLWTHNDKGDSARFFALNRTGRCLGIFELAEGEKPDYEDIAMGPGPDSGVDYLYLGDIGDNDEDRPSIRIYRIPEPTVDVNRFDIRQTVSRYDALTLYYPDGPRDAETLMVDPWTADLYLVTKYTQPTEIYRAPYPQTSKMTLERVAIFTADWDTSSDKDWVGPTGGDIAPDGRQILIRGYDKGYLWQITDGDSPLWEVFQEDPVEIPLGPEEQGEAIAFAADSQGYFTTSEGTQCALYYYARSKFTVIGPPATNEAPNDILPSSMTIRQNSPAGLVVGNLQAQDPDVRDLHRYSLVSGEGDRDNSRFILQEDRLIAAETLDRPVQEYYSVRLRCEDRVGHGLEKTLRVEVGYGPSPIWTDFTLGAEGFVYLDDAFRQTAQPAYAQGYWDPLNGDPDGALIVQLDGVDKRNTDGMSGGWRCTFSVPETSIPWVLGLSYRLWPNGMKISVRHFRVKD